MITQATVRMGVKDDVFQLFDLISSTSFGVEAGYVRNVYPTLADMNKRVLNGLETPFVALDDAGRIVSMLTVTRRAEPGNAAIPMIVTASDRRRRGHSTAVLRYALETLGELGFRKVFATCPLENEAVLAAVGRVGFAPEGRLLDVYGPSHHAVMCGRLI